VKKMRDAKRYLGLLYTVVSPVTDSPLFYLSVSFCPVGMIFSRKGSEEDERCKKLFRASLYRCFASYGTLQCAIQFTRLYFCIYKTHYHVISGAREQKIGTM
jgi:hypothetical protein